MPTVGENSSVPALVGRPEDACHARPPIRRIARYKAQTTLQTGAAFAASDVELATERAHLTTAAAGSIAREAAVKRVEPFHFSPRYSGQGTRLIDEVMAAFAGQ